MSSDLPLQVQAKEFEFKPMLDQLSQETGDILIIHETFWPSSLPPLQQADFKNHFDLEKQKKVFLQYNPDGIFRNTLPYWDPDTFIMEISRPVSPSCSRPVSPSYYPSDPPYGSQTYWDIIDAKEVEKLDFLKRSGNLASRPEHVASRHSAHISKGRHSAV